MLKSTPVVLGFLLFGLASVQILAQGVAWNGTGPSVNVRAYGALGDVQANIDGVVAANTKVLTSGSIFTASDVGKILWIDQAPFQAPTLVSITVSSSCTGGLLANTSTYNYNVYYRMSYTKSSGAAEGNPSVEGFVALTPGSGQCVKITSPTSLSGASHYNVYFGADAPPPWMANTAYSMNAKVLDTNGNVEIATVGGTSGSSNPPWNTQVGLTTKDGTAPTQITWRNEGPVVPGSGSGTELLASNATNCANGNPLVSMGSVNCEIDTLPSTVGGTSPPSVIVFNAGMITAQTTHTITFSTVIPNAVMGAVNNNSFAWGHDDSPAVTNALSALTAASPAVGGTLFFPVSSGCYAVTSLINISQNNGSFLNFEGEGSASSKHLGGPFPTPNQPASACIATISTGGGAGFSFGSAGNMMNAGPLVERLGFLDPFGAAAAALTFYGNASTKVLHNSFQGYSSGTAILFDAGSSIIYSQFVQASDNICISVKSCIVMNDGITNPAWIERNRCVSAQTGGGRCVQIGPNSAIPGNGGGTNWIVENFALYFPISYESTDIDATYWIGNSNQQTAALQSPMIPNIIGGGGSGVGTHIGSSSTGTKCFDNEVIAGNTTSNAVGLFIDAPCTKTLYMGYTVASAPTSIADFGSQSVFWSQEFGLHLAAQAGADPLVVNDQAGHLAFKVQTSGLTAPASMNATGSITTTQLATPSAPAVTPTCQTACTSSWSYKIVAKDCLGGGTLVGGSIASGPGTTALQNVTLSSSPANFNVISWSPVPQACSYDVWRTSVPISGNPPTTGVIGNVGSTANLTFTDNNVAPTTISCVGALDCSPTVNASGSIGSALNSVDKGYFVSTGLLSGANVSTGTNTPVSSSGDVRVVQFFLPVAMTVGRVTITVSAAGAASSTVTVGIYDANGNKLFDSGGVGFNGASVATQTLTITPFTLVPGVYYFAQSASSAGSIPSTQTISTGSAVVSVLNNQTIQKWGKCANAATGATLPTVCGTISNLSFAPVLAAFER